jgi:pimeloyl-ACP methyl ester carboxylesterase
MLAVIREWGTIPASGRYATLKDITQPTLIVHGNKDTVVIPANAFIMETHLPAAELLMFPDASLGALNAKQKTECRRAAARLRWSFPRGDRAFKP